MDNRDLSRFNQLVLGIFNLLTKFGCFLFTQVHLPSPDPLPLIVHSNSQGGQHIYCIQLHGGTSLLACMHGHVSCIQLHGYSQLSGLHVWTCLMHPASWLLSALWPACMDRSHASSFMVTLSSLACMYGYVSCTQLHGGTQLSGLHVWICLMHPASWLLSALWPACMDMSHASSFMVALSSLACMYGYVSCIQLHGGTQLSGLHVWICLMHPASWWHSVLWPACMDRSHASSFMVALAFWPAYKERQVSFIQLHGGTDMYAWIGLVHRASWWH